MLELADVLAAQDRDALPAGGTVRLVVDGRQRHAPVGVRGESRAFLGAYDNARQARERDGRDRLAEWVDDRELGFDRSVLVDVVEAGEAYGLRVPGEDAVYEVQRGPADSLGRIAEDLES
jgi:hypothetical protein